MENNIDETQKINKKTLLEVKGFYYDMLKEASLLKHDDEACTNFIDKWCDKMGASVSYKIVSVEYASALIDLKTGNQTFSLNVGGISNTGYDTFINKLCYGYSVINGCNIAETTLYKLLKEEIDIKEANINIEDDDKYAGVCHITFYDGYTGSAEILSETKDTIKIQYICAIACYEEKNFHPEKYEMIAASKDIVYEITDRNVWEKQNVLTKREEYINDEKEYFDSLGDERPAKKAKSR